MSHLLAADLRRQILRGDLAADQQLPTEPELTAALDVSRETLREALRILESQSLLEIRRGRNGGAVVRRPGLASVSRYVALLLQVRGTTLGDLEEARAVVEPSVAEELALRCGDEEVAQLVALHDVERAAESDPLAFATAVAGFDQAVTELSGNRTVAVLAGVLRDIYAGQVYAAIGAADHAAGERIARRVVVSHSAFLDAARRRDGSLAREAWADYLFSTSRLLVDRNRSRERIDVVPLWRAQASRAAGEQAPRAATAVATEIRSRIAEGRLCDGDRLGGLAELGAEFGISRPTLREALRILETEHLLDLRTGDRGGARVREPSTQVAAQLAGTILEARGTTLADLYRAVRLVEPAMIELVVSRIGARSVRSLHRVAGALAAATDDLPGFMRIWRQGSAVVFGAARNPAVAVLAELLQWARVGAEPAVRADASTDVSWLTKTRPMAQLFAELVAAFEAGDASRAGATWDSFLKLNSPYIESSALGGRLMIDLID